MKKFNVRVWYTVPRWKEITIEANSQQDAYRIGMNMLESEDTFSWNEWDDAEREIDVEEVR